VKKIDLGQTITILANLGVIVGIGFLAVEARQNGDLLKVQVKLLAAEADYNYYQGRAQNRQMIATDPEYAEFWTKVVLGNAATTEVEKVRLKAHIEGTVLGWQYEYGQIVEGNFIDGADAARDRWRAALDPDSGGAFATEFGSVWTSLRPTLRKDFVEFIEENVMLP
jgi:hypothetical protein